MRISIVLPNDVLIPYAEDDHVGMEILAGVHGRNLIPVGGATLFSWLLVPNMRINVTLKLLVILALGPQRCHISVSKVSASSVTRCANVVAGLERGRTCKHKRR